MHFQIAWQISPNDCLIYLIVNSLQNMPNLQHFPYMIAAISDEKLLIKHLLDNYERVGVVGRPVANISETVLVRFGVALTQILDLDEKNQVLTTNVWNRHVSFKYVCSLFNDFGQKHNVHYC